MSMRHPLALHSAVGTIRRIRTRSVPGHHQPRPHYPKRYEFLEWSGTAREMDHL